MTRSRRVAGLLLTAVLAALPLSGFPSWSTVHADTPQVSFDPSRGGVDDYSTVTTSTGCPAQATHVLVLVSGGEAGTTLVDAPAVGLTEIAALHRTADGGLVLPLTVSMRDLAQAGGVTGVAGTYRYVVRCRTQADPTSLGDLVGALTWSGGSSTSFAATYRVTRIGPPRWKPTLTGRVVSGGLAQCVVAFDDVIGTRFAWSVDGSVVPGATASSLTVSERWYRKAIACAAVATGTDGSTAAASSDQHLVGMGTALRPVSAPVLSGSPRPGRALTVSPGSWSPAATSYSLRWLRDGRVVTGRTSRTYLVGVADVGHLLTAVVTAHRTGWRDGAVQRSLRASA